MRASQCVLLGDPTHGTSDGRCVFFQRKRNKGDPKMIHGSSLRPARALSSLGGFTIQVSPAENAQAAFLPFL